MECCYKDEMEEGSELYTKWRLDVIRRLEEGTIMWLIWDLFQIITGLVVGTICLTAIYVLLFDNNFRN